MGARGYRCADRAGRAVNFSKEGKRSSVRALDEIGTMVVSQEPYTVRTALKKQRVLIFFPVWLVKSGEGGM